MRIFIGLMLPLACLAASVTPWTQYPDGRQMSLWFGNLTEDTASIIQAREIPGAYGSAVCTFAPHHGSPYGAIGFVSNRKGPEGDDAASMRPRPGTARRGSTLPGLAPP